MICRMTVTHTAEKIGKHLLAPEHKSLWIFCGVLHNSETVTSGFDT